MITVRDTQHILWRVDICTVPGRTHRPTGDANRNNADI